VQVVVEDDPASIVPGHVRVIGTVPSEVLASLYERGCTVDRSPVVPHGRIELLRWTREQATSETLHRYGNLRAPNRSAADAPQARRRRGLGSRRQRSSIEP
jgi:hypothetical protein